MKKSAIAVIATVLTLQGCAWQRTIETRDRIDQERKEIENSLASNRAERPRVVQEREKPWVSTKPLPLEKAASIPAALKCSVSFNPEQPVSIFEFAQMITNWCGVPVRVTQDAVQKLSGLSSTPFVPPISTLSGSAALPPLPGQPSGPTVPAIHAGASSTVANLGPRGMISGIKWSNKPINGLLPVVASRLGISWKYEQGSIYFFHTETKMYEIQAIRRTLNMRSTVSSGTEVMAQSSAGGGAGSGSGNASGGGVDVSGGSKQTTEVAIQTDLTKDIETTLKALVTPQVGVLAMASGAGMVTVTDTPEAHARISQFMAKMNYAVTRQVKLLIDIYNLQLNDLDDYGLDLNLVYEKLGRFSAGLNSALPLNSQALSSTINVLDNRWAGSSAMFQALSTQGHIKSKQNNDVMALNLSAVPVQIAKTKGFVASQQTTQTANVGSQTSLVAGSVTTGFNMTVMPRILDDDRLVLYFSASIAPDATIRPITGDGIKLEVPDTQSKAIAQEVILRSGQTIIMSGYEVVNEATDQRGTGEPGFFGLGGGFKRTKQKEVLVIVITPIISEDRT